jgi:hypothetical protein
MNIFCEVSFEVSSVLNYDLITMDSNSDSLPFSWSERSPIFSLEIDSCFLRSVRDDNRLLLINFFPNCHLYRESCNPEDSGLL